MACRIVHGPVDVADVGDLDGRSPGDVKGEVRRTDGETVHPGRRRDREGDGRRVGEDDSVLRQEREGREREDREDGAVRVAVLERIDVESVDLHREGQRGRIDAVLAGEREQGGARRQSRVGGAAVTRPRQAGECRACRPQEPPRDSAAMWHRALLLAVVWTLPVAVRTGAQAWNSPAALDLARRAIARRTRAAADTALHDYKAQAHGFLFFLGQLGEGLADPPRLVKADQLELEVYWKAPASSKQRVVGWRDRAELPTDIYYHRDHLGIVQNNFGPAIRLGEGDEVRDVPHPLSAAGPDLYDYALADSTTITFPAREVRVVALRVRPKDFAAPRIVGTLYVDATTADLVRLAFNFTPHAYLDAQLEDVSIVLDNALWEARFWLPYRQELEIRRRATWLDMPARGIIRARWEIDGYLFNVGLATSWFQGDEITFLPKAERDSFPWRGAPGPAAEAAGGASWEIDGYLFNVGLATSWFQGDEITFLPKAERDSFPWREPLAQAMEAVAEPVRQNDLERVRAEVEQIAGRHALTGLKAHRLGVRGLSDLVRANRVEGLTLGAGLVWRGGGERRELRVTGSYGFSDRRPKGSVTASDRAGRRALELAVFREVRDVGDERVIAPLLNSFSSQEFAADYGDYYRADGARLTYRHGSCLRGECS